jgi:hypothetical protein
VRDTWESLVVTHHHLFIGLLIAFETVAGLAVLWRGRARSVSLALLILFNLTLVVFAWGFLVWAAPLVFALVLLLRADPRRLEPDVHQAPAVPDRDTELASALGRAGYR